MENKEKRVEEMSHIIENAFKVYFGANDLVEPEDFPYQAKDLAKELLEYYQPKLPEDSVVLSTEELKDIVKARTKCVENAIIRTRKETVEKILNKVYSKLTEPSTWKQLRTWWLYNGECEQLKALLNEIATCEGVKIKE